MNIDQLRAARDAAFAAAQEAHVTGDAETLHAAHLALEKAEAALKAAEDPEPPSRTRVLCFLPGASGTTRAYRGLHGHYDFRFCPEHNVCALEGRDHSVAEWNKLADDILRGEQAINHPVSVRVIEGDAGDARAAEALTAELAEVASRLQTRNKEFEQLEAEVTNLRELATAQSARIAELTASTVPKEPDPAESPSESATEKSGEGEKPAPAETKPRRAARTTKSADPAES